MPEKKTKDDSSVVKKSTKSLSFLARLPVAIVVGVIVIVLGGILSALGFGDKVNIGGILGQLLGVAKNGKDPIDIANEVPEGRTDESGEKIDKETTGPEGFEQQKVRRLDKSSGMFRDKQTIEVGGSQGKETIKLPKGIRDSDVKEVYEVTPGKFKIITHSTPEGGPSNEDIEKLREKLQ